MRAPEFWTRNDFASQLAVAALTPLGWAYGASVAWKAAHTVPYRSKAKVICVGNLTAGGSGKTPVAIAIARALIERNLRVIFLSRGFGGRRHGAAFVDPKNDCAADVGDEPLLLAGSAPVIVSRDRAAGARLADAEGADVIIMDDGHQNFSVAKDLSLVIVDAKAAFGNGRILPAGPLRESASQGLSRADAVVLVGEGAPSLNGFAKPVLRARLVPADGAELRVARVVAFAGIGRPEKFFETLHALGAEIVETCSFADHHAYTAAEVARLKRKAANARAMLVTTEKDHVRLTAAERAGIAFLPVRATFEDTAALARLLDSMSPRAIPAP
ncbi:MAG TPA: tetraacyldisaccharide 4'-kinase [Rhizomicrobium sp.]|nr:tetraacyldisaccharide 4'-kinase [Rhizomicrobium sp.]